MFKKSNWQNTDQFLCESVRILFCRDEDLNYTKIFLLYFVI